MTTRRPRLQAAALIFATLGFGACGQSRQEGRETWANGISLSVPASEITQREAGVQQWDVALQDDGSYVVVAVDAGGQRVAQMRLEWSATHGSSIAFEQGGSGEIVMDAAGELLENTMDDAALVEFFRADAETELVDQGFRLSPQCMMANQQAFADCSKAMMTKQPMDILKCAASVAAAALACQGGGGMPGMTGGGMPGMTGGGGMTDGGGEGGNGTGGYEDDGGYDTGGGSGGGGYEDGGYGTGGGYEDGGYGTGGGYEDGGGYEGGGYEGGGYEGGGYEGGGYEGGGYEGGGYDGGGYYDGGDDAGGSIAEHHGIPTAVAPHLAFGEAGAPARLKVGRWNLPRGR